MSEAKLGTGFRFGKVVAWAPAVILVVAFVLLATGELLVGVALGVFAVLTWFLVSRRKKQVEEGTPPAAERPAPSAGAGTPDA